MKNQNAILDHINFSVNSFDKTVKWYQRIFNFKLVENGQREDGNKWGIIKNGNSMFAFTEYLKKKLHIGESELKINHFGLRLEDKDEWEEKLEKYKLQTYYGSPVRYENSTSWYVKDPSGHEIEVSIWKNNKVVF